MDIKKMSPEKRHRMMKWIRVPKSYRITKHTNLELDLLSNQLQTSETAIIEAAVHRLYQAFNIEKMKIAMGGQDGFSSEILSDVEGATTDEKISDHLVF